MWDKIFDLKTIMFMKKASGDSEDEKSIMPFIRFIQEKMDYKVVVVLATQWDIYNEEQQINMAKNYAGVNHLSRFLLWMDYLSYRYKKGELK